MERRTGENRTHLVVRVSIKKDRGWYMATCRDLPGLVLASQDRDAIIDDLPAAIGLLYSERYQCECRVEAKKNLLAIFSEWLKGVFSGSESSESFALHSV